MKMSPRVLKAQKNMAPGVITGEGFLGQDTRDINLIIEEDKEQIQHLGFSLEEASSKLNYLMEEGKKGLGEPITIEKWLVQTNEARGFLACPFEDGISHKITAVITNIQNGQKLIVSELALHLIDSHSFLQGEGSSFRLDPKEIQRVLEL